MTRFLKSARAIAAVLCIAAACLLPCLAFADEVEAEGPYAILYENGDLVIQDSATPMGWGRFEVFCSLVKR